MKKEIYQITAINEQGTLVKADDSLKGNKYFCPVCNAELILKKSGNVGKGSRRPHFAHYKLSQNCSPETVLHYSFKKMLLEYIKDNIIKKLPMHIILECNTCKNKIPMNILGNCINVKEEYDMNICRPDIALIEEKENVYAVFEIVVTHKPEQNVINYYQQNNIILFQIDLDSEDDLENINETLNKKTSIKARPDYFNACINPNCNSKKRKYRNVVRRSRRF